MSRVNDLRIELAFAEEQEGLAQAALAKKARFAKFYVAHYQVTGSKPTGSFIGLACKACNRWEENGHAVDCSTGELELQEAEIKDWHALCEYLLDRAEMPVPDHLMPVWDTYEARRRK